MRRVPVAPTIRDAYSFIFTHLGSIIGLIWVPMLLLTVMGFFSFQRYYNDFIAAMAGGNPSALGSSLLMMLGYMVAALLLEAMILVSVVQLAQGTRDPKPVLAHFSFGPSEWRMFRALIALVGLLLLFLFPTYVAAGALSVVLGNRGAVMTNLSVMALYAVILAATPRFLLLLPAISVNEHVPVLRRAWALSAGNFWRLLAILVGATGPVLLAMGIIDAVLSGGGATVAAGATPEEQMVAAVRQASDVLPLMSGLSFLISPLLVGLVARASVTCWRALTTQSVDISA